MSIISGEPATYVVTRLRRDNGAWNAKTEFLLVERYHGAYDWVDRPQHASRLSLAEAASIARAEDVFEDIAHGSDRQHDYGIEERVSAGRSR